MYLINYHFQGVASMKTNPVLLLEVKLNRMVNAGY